jgi:hypothetical protein
MKVFSETMFVFQVNFRLGRSRQYHYTHASMAVHIGDVAKSERAKWTVAYEKQTRSKPVDTYNCT